MISTSTGNVPVEKLLIFGFGRRVGSRAHFSFLVIDDGNTELYEGDPSG